MVIVANSNFSYSPGTRYNDINTISGGVTSISSAIPAAIAPYILSVGGFGKPVMQDFMNIMCSSAPPERTNNPIYTHYETGTMRNGIVSAGSTIGSAGAAKTITVNALSVYNGFVNARVGQKINVGGIQCIIKLVTPATPSITVYPIIAGQTIPATVNTEIMGYLDNAQEIGGAPDMALPQFGKYPFTNYIQTYSTPLFNTNAIGSAMQDQFAMQDNWLRYSLMPGSAHHGYFNPTGMDLDNTQLLMNRATALALSNHFNDIDMSWVFGEATTNPVLQASYSNGTLYTTKGLFSQITSYGGAFTYVQSTGMTNQLFYDIAAQDRYYGYDTKEYLMLPSSNVRQDFSTFIRSFQSTFNTDNINTDGFSPEQAMYLNSTYRGINIDGKTYRVHNEFNIAEHASVQIAKYKSYCAVVPLVKNSMNTSTNVMRKVLMTKGTGSYNANTSFNKDGQDGIFSDEIHFDVVGAKSSGAPVSTTLQDILQGNAISRVGLKIFSPYTMSSIIPV